MGRGSRSKRERVRDVQRDHDSGVLRCSNCGVVISPNSRSFSADMPWGLVVSCYRCAPALMQVLDDLLGTGRAFQEGWLLHCAGDDTALESLAG